MILAILRAWNALTINDLIGLYVAGTAWFAVTDPELEIA